MISVTKVTQVLNQNYSNEQTKKVGADLYGLSTDTKPLGYANGSTFLEKQVDASGDFTGVWSIYIFDEENQSWDKFSSWSVS